MTIQNSRLNKISNFTNRLFLGRRLFYYCLIVAAAFSLAPRLYSLSYGNLDPSFNYAFNQAAATKMSFGNNFISTYGPLGYLISNFLPQNLYKTSLWQIVYVILLALGVYLFVTYYCVRTNKKILLATILLFIFSISNGGDSFEWNLLSLFLLYCFLYLRLKGNKRLIVGIGLSVATAIFCLIKFTTGAGAILTLILLPLFAPKSGIRLRLKYTMVMVIVFFGSFLIIGIHLGIDNFIAYVKTGFLLSNGFSAAMPLYSYQTAAATIFLGLSLVLLVVWTLFEKRIAPSFRYLFIVPPILIMWKYCVVRQDAHLLRSIQLIWPLVVLILLSRFKRVRTDLIVASLIIVFSVFSIWGNMLPFSGNASFASAVTEPLTNIINANSIKFFDFNSQRKNWSSQSALGLQNATLPIFMRQKISNNGVDIFPWETDIIAANSLTWQPRPSPFSFESYDPYLDDLNTNYFNSPKAPKFIIWHNTGVNSIDYRYLLWDEPKTFRTIMQNYSFVDSSSEFMLFERIQKPAEVQQHQLSSLKTNWGDWTTIPHHNISAELFAQIEVKRDVQSKLTTLLLRSDSFSIEFRTQKNKTISYQFVLENAPQGLLIDNLPLTWGNIVSLAQSRVFTGDELEAFRLIQSSSSPPTHSPVLVHFFTQTFKV
jgi:hypothetical protein